MNRRLGIAALIATALVVGMAIVIHTPPFRAFVLRRVVAQVQKTYGIQIDAGSLDYNLASLRVALTYVRVGVRGEPPFFEADRVEAALARSVWAGRIAFDEVTATRARVRVTTHADGRSNLPPSSARSTGEPAPLRIARLSVPDLRVDIRDEARDLRVSIPAVAVQLAADDGRITLDAPATIAVGGTATRITRAGGRATFDGRDLQLRDLNVEAQEGTARVGGTVALIRAMPGIDLTVDATVDARQAARWAMPVDSAPAGRVRASGRVRGPFGAPAAELAIESEAVSWASVMVTDVRAQTSVSPDGLTVTQGSLAIDGGRLTLHGAVPFGGARRADVHASWSGVQAEPLVRRFTSSAVLPVGALSGTLDAQGTGSLAGWDADVRVDVSDAADRSRRISVPGQTRLHLAGGSWRLDGEHRVAHGVPITLRLRGRAAEPLPASTVAGEVRVAPTAIDRVTRLVTTLGFGAVPPEVVGGGTIDAVASVTGIISAPRVRFSAATANAVTSAGSGRLNASGDYDGRSGAYTLALHADDWRLAPTHDLPLAAAVAARVDLRGRGSRVDGDGDITATHAQWEAVQLGDVAAHVTFADNVAHVTAHAPDFSLDADATVHLSAPYDATVTATTTDLDLARALRDVPSSEPVTGRVSARLDASGPIANWRRGRAQLQIASVDAHAGDLALRLTEPARVGYAADRISVERLEAAAGQTHLSVSGQLPVSGPAAPDASTAIVAMLTGDLGEVVRAITATRLATAPIEDASGPVVLLARVTGSLAAPSVAADLELGPSSITARRDLPPATGVRLRAHLENNLMELREAAASFEGAMLSATGDAPLAWLTRDPADRLRRPATVHARVTGLTPMTLRPFASTPLLDDLTGAVDADVTLSSPTWDLADARGELRLDRFELAAAGLPVTQRVPTRITLERGVARIEVWDWTGEAASLTLRGDVRLAERQASLQANGDIDLRVLTPYVRDAGISIAGRMQPRVTITGALDAPRISGEIALTGGEARLVHPRVVLADLTGRALLGGTTVTLASLTGTANGGDLRATGSADYGSAGRIDTHLDVEVNGMALDFPEGLRTELNGAIALTLSGGAGQPAPGGTLTGTVTVLEGAYRDPLPVIAGLLASVRARASTTSDTPSPLLEGLTLNVRVVTDDDLVVDNNIARAQLGADLRVIGTAAAPALSGRVDVRDGGQLYLGRNVYTVDMGAIDFANPTTIEPNLDVTATTRVGGDDVQVHISGTPDTLSTELTSPTNPSLGQADLASLLLTGRTLDALPSEQAAVIGAEFLGNLSGDVLGYASRAIGLDVLRLGGIDTQGARRDPTIVATEIDPTARLTFGKSLGRNVDVTFSQSLRDADAQTWIVDYLPTRQLAMRVVSNDEDLRAYQFRHDVSFGGSAVRGARRTPRTGRGTEQPRVTSVALQGTLAFPEAELRKQLSLTQGDRFDFIAWQRDRDRLQDFYIAHRHLAARVSAQRRTDPSALTLTYVIDAGPETAIVVTGETLDAAVRAKIESAWATSVFDGFFVEEARAIVRDALAAEGYGRADVRASLSAVAGVRTLTIAVDRGERVEGLPPAAPAAAPIRVVGDVTFVRAASLPAESIRAAAALAPGAAADAVAIEEARGRVQALFRREGYAAARVTARQNVHAAQGTVDVTFDVDEGARQVVGAVVVEGNRGTDADVVTRALRLQVGEPLRAQDWLEARRRAFDTGLFRRVDLAIEPMTTGAPAVDAATQPMRVRAVVEEWPALRLRYGVQAAEERPEGATTGRNVVPGVNADVTRRTLFGRAVAVGAAFELQRRDRSGRAFLNAPTIASLPVASSLIVERSRQNFAAATLVTDRSTVAWEERLRTLRNRLNLSSTYRFERNHTFDTGAITNPLFPRFDITINIARLTAAGAWDTRDDAGNTAHGSLLSFTFEYAPETLGSDIRFVRHLAQAYHFRTWRGLVFASAARAGVVTPLGGQQLIPSVRFFSGGARSVRGVGEDRLGPPDVFGDPAGGRVLAILNQELRFPLYRWLRGVGFVDAGNVYARPGDFAIRTLVGAAGGGVRLVTPVALLRIDYGRQVWPGPIAGSGRWFFGLGQSF